MPTIQLYFVVLQAFLAASMKSDEELIGWFRERLVWNDPAVVMDLLKNGLFVRLYTPQVNVLQFPGAMPFLHIHLAFG